MEAMAVRGKQDIFKKASVLKLYEQFGFRVAYSLLEDEALAVEATTQALIEIFKDDEFFNQTNALQKQLVKKVIVKQSLSSRALMIRQTHYKEMR